MKQWKTIALMLGCAFIFSGFTVEHEYYVSVGEMRLNTNGEDIDFVLRIFSDDLEFALSEEGNPGIDVLNDEEAEDLVSAYVLEHFEVYDELGEKIELTFSDMEGDADAVLVFLEAKSSSDHEFVSIKHSVLMDHFPDQVNILHYSNPAEPSSYRFTDALDREKIQL